MMALSLGEMKVEAKELSQEQDMEQKESSRNNEKTEQIMVPEKKRGSTCEEG